MLTPAGDSLYTANLRSALCTNTYIPRADGRFTYQPLLVYQGFRFVEVTGLAEMPRPEDITGLVQYDEMEECAGFECDNELLNRLHSNALWGIRGNYHGMPTDCPQRDERLGWTGDRLTGCYGENILMDNGALYYKWLHDLVDSQNEAGQIAHLTPDRLPISPPNTARGGTTESHGRGHSSMPPICSIVVMATWMPCTNYIPTCRSG